MLMDKTFVLWSNEYPSLQKNYQHLTRIKFIYVYTNTYRELKDLLISPLPGFKSGTNLEKLNAA